MSNFLIEEEYKKLEEKLFIAEAKLEGAEEACKVLRERLEFIEKIYSLDEGEWFVRIKADDCELVDCIDRESLLDGLLSSECGLDEVIEGLIFENHLDYLYDNDEDGVRNFADDLIRNITNFIKTEPSVYLPRKTISDWIGVKERLPHKDEYITTWKDGSESLSRLLIAYTTDTIEYEIGCYDGYKWMDEWGTEIIRDVIAWKKFEPYSITDQDRTRAMWIKKGYQNIYTHCSNCETRALFNNHGELILSKFCPYCGMEMENANENN